MLMDYTFGAVFCGPADDYRPSSLATESTPAPRKAIGKNRKKKAVRRKSK
jgi:hypothetical protein